MGKRYPLKAVGTLGGWGVGGGEAEEAEPTWEHKALSGTDSTLGARCKSTLWEAPEKGAYQPEETIAKELNPERSSFMFNC